MNALIQETNKTIETGVECERSPELAEQLLSPRAAAVGLIDDFRRLALGSVNAG